MKYIRFIGATYENWWRAKVPMEKLQSLGYKAIYSTLLPYPWNSKGLPYKEGMPDVIVLNFVSGKDATDIDTAKKSNLIATLQRYRELYGTRIVYDMDDNIFALFDDHGYAVDDLKDSVPNVVAMLNFADVITVSTEKLYNLLADLQKKTYVLPNCIPDNLSCASRVDALNVVKGDIRGDRLILPVNDKYNSYRVNHYSEVLDKLIDQHNKILFIGYGAEKVPQYQKGYTLPFTVTMDTYLSLLKEANINWGAKGIIRFLAPSTENFSIYKSNIKILEAGVSGLGLLIDGKVSPEVYDIKSLKHTEIDGYKEPLIWIPASECRDLVEDYRIGKHIQKWVEAYGL